MTTAGIVNVMRKHFLIFFLIFGAIDFFYGLYVDDRISMLIGALMVIITVFLVKKEKENSKQE